MKKYSQVISQSYRGDISIAYTLQDLFEIKKNILDV